jgi:hypothetical protein
MFIKKKKKKKKTFAVALYQKSDFRFLFGLEINEKKYIN